MANLKDVAKAAGVSMTTASVILNPGKQVNRISPECSERVRLAAKRLSYVTNYHARAMQVGCAETLGLAIDTGSAGHKDESTVAMGGPYFQHLAGGVETYTHSIGYNLAIIGPGNIKETGQHAQDRGLRQLLQRRLDALVVAAILPTIERSELLKDAPKLPVVLVEYSAPTELPVVTYDEEAGVRRAVQHLVELGHRELLWLGPRNDASYIRPAGALDREQLFVQAAWDAGVRGSSCRFPALNYPVRQPDLIAEATRAALAERLGKEQNFTAIVCYNDVAAIGAYEALYAAGLRIPEQMSVIGFDNFYAAQAVPRLTTVDHMIHEMGLRAAQLAHEMAQDPATLQRLRGHREVLAPKLMVRHSTAPAPNLK